MIYTPMTLRAMRLAYDAHAGAVDKAGAPYIFHPLHLAEQMDDEVSCAAALLHDVVEDTPVTLEALRREFPPAVTDAVALLTRDPAADYFDYVSAIRRDPVAMKVKLADLAHNSDPARQALARLDDAERARLRAKYARAREILLSDAPPLGGR